jgi:hypothetical protein
MKPEFVNALENCINFSCKNLININILATKGKSAYMLKDSYKRKRSKREIEEVKEEEK